MKSKIAGSVVSDAIDVGDDVVAVTMSYSRGHQGVVVTYMVDSEFSEIDLLVDLATVFQEFVLTEFGKFLKDFDFHAKFSVPMVVCIDGCIRLVLCYVTDDGDDVVAELDRMGIPEESVLGLR